MQEALVHGEPQRFFKPQPSKAGTFSDWLGVYLDAPDVNWDEIATLLEDAYRTIAPKKLVALLDKE